MASSWAHASRMAFLRALAPSSRAGRAVALNHLSTLTAICTFCLLLSPSSCTTSGITSGLSVIPSRRVQAWRWAHLPTGLASSVAAASSGSLLTLLAMESAMWLSPRPSFLIRSQSAASTSGVGRCTTADQGAQ